MPDRYTATLVTLVILAGTPALGADAHVHGQAHLSIAVDGPALTLMLKSPASNLLGFEHTPRTEAEQAALKRMHGILNRPADLFVFTAAADCRPDQTRIAAGHLDGKTKGHANQHAAEHADVVAEFGFRCTKPEALTGLEVRLFNHFRGLTKLKVALAGPHSQKATTLNPKNRLLAW